MSRLSKSNVLDLSIVLQLFSAFDLFFSSSIVVMACQPMRVRFCTRKVPARCLLGATVFFDDCSRFQKKGTYTQDSQTITKTTALASKMVRHYQVLPIFFLFPLPFLLFLNSFFLSPTIPSFTLLFPFSFAFFFAFPCPFLVLFLAFFLYSSFFPFPHVISLIKV